VEQLRDGKKSSAFIDDAAASSTHIWHSLFYHLDSQVHDGINEKDQQSNAIGVWNLAKKSLKTSNHNGRWSLKSGKSSSWRQHSSARLT
jgi:hypothetical protein